MTQQVSKYGSGFSLFGLNKWRMETRGVLGYTDCAILLSAKCRTFKVTQGSSCSVKKVIGIMLLGIQREKSTFIFSISCAFFFHIIMTKVSTFFSTKWWQLLHLPNHQSTWMKILTLSLELYVKANTWWGFGDVIKETYRMIVQMYKWTRRGWGPITWWSEPWRSRGHIRLEQDNE